MFPVLEVIKKYKHNRSNTKRYISWVRSIEVFKCDAYKRNVYIAEIYEQLKEDIKKEDDARSYNDGSFIFLILEYFGPRDN